MELLGRGRLSAHLFLEVFACAAGPEETPPYAVFGHGDLTVVQYYNVLRLQPLLGSPVPCLYSEDVDLVAAVLEGLRERDELRSLTLQLAMGGFERVSFSSREWALTAEVLRGLSVAEQVRCVQAGSNSWLATVCEALGGEALAAAERRLTVSL